MTDTTPRSVATAEKPLEVMRETAAQHFSLAFIKNTKAVGLAMIIIGVLGILLPNLISLAFNTYVGGIFLISAIALAFNAWQYKKQDMSLWFKPFILMALALIIFTHPGIILGVLGLLIAIYFLISGFSAVVVSFGLSSSAKFFSLLSGVISFVLGVIVLTNWPFASGWIIGLTIGVTFFFDGIALLSISNQVKKTQEKLIN
jgi:uncharacterized membrane protein HdeD (DUF308 family)